MPGRRSRAQRSGRVSDSHLRSAANLLSIVRRDTDTIGVALSFGKDSLATLDLCTRMFRRVEAYYLYRVRGLRVVSEWAEEVRRRYGIAVRMYPHFDLVRCYRAALLQPHWRGLGRHAAGEIRRHRGGVSRRGGRGLDRLWLVAKR